MKNAFNAKLISLEGQPPQYYLAYRNIPFGVLVGECADACNPRTKLSWRLVLAPKKENSRDWDYSAKLTATQALTAAEKLAKMSDEEASLGRYVTIRYSSAYGFECYLDHDANRTTVERRHAKAFTHTKAREIIDNATADDLPLEFPGDRWVKIDTVDKLGQMLDQAPIQKILLPKDNFAENNIDK